MLRPGFEPGSGDRESPMLGRTTLPEQKELVRNGSAPSGAQIRVSPYMVLNLKKYQALIQHQAIIRRVRKLRSACSMEETESIRSSYLPTAEANPQPHLGPIQLPEI